AGDHRAGAQRAAQIIVGVEGDVAAGGRADAGRNGGNRRGEREGLAVNRRRGRAADLDAAVGFLNRLAELNGVAGVETRIAAVAGVDRVAGDAEVGKMVCRLAVHQADHADLHAVDAEGHVAGGRAAARGRDVDGGGEGDVLSKFGRRAAGSQAQARAG